MSVILREFTTEESYFAVIPGVIRSFAMLRMI